MNYYTVTFTDNTQAQVNAYNPEKAVLKANRQYCKTVVSVSLGRPVVKATMGSFESMKRGGPNC